MNIQVLSAHYGDDKTLTNVTGALGRELAKAGKDLNIPVGSNLVPLFSAGDTYTLSSAEEERARQMAAQQCEGGRDQACFNSTFERLKVQMLKEKQDTAYLKEVKGPRLEARVKINNKLMTVKIPEGQRITVDSLQGRAPDRNAPFDVKKTMELGRVAGDSASRTLGDVGRSLLGTLGPTVLIVLGTIGYSLSVFLTWISFGRDGYTTLKYIATAVSVLLPFSGFVLVPSFFGLREFAARMKPVLDAAKAQNQSL